MTRTFARLIVGLGFVLWASAGLAVEGVVGSLAEAKAQVQQDPTRHILVFYKNYRS